MQTMHALDNPIWAALKTSQAHFAEIHECARRFQAEVSPLAGFAEPTAENYRSLAALVPAQGSVGVFLLAPPNPPAEWTIIAGGSLLQMIHADGDIPLRDCDFDQLTERDVPEMLALVELTKPGPFNKRTRELGNYIAVRVEGRLAAMAGERLQFPGYTEVSAVCTHPDFLGRGYATALIAVLVQQIRGRGETPFLHTRADNTRAIALYERLGFTRRLLYHYAILRKG